MELKINKRIKAVLGSPTLAITARAKELKAQGADVVNFAAGEPDFDTPDSIKQAARQALADGLTKYTPSTGTLQLREAISKKFKEDNNLDYKPAQIAVGCGAKHSLFSVIQVLIDEGDEVIIPAPYWVSYPEMVKIAGGTVVSVATSGKDNFKLTAESLAEKVTDKTKLLILNTPSNPTGMLYSKVELEKIAEVCVKNNIYVLSDEIYERLLYVDEPYVSIASLNEDIYNLTITVNGVSKAYSMTGWRIGYCAAANQDIISYVKKLQDHSTSNPCSISQMAALQAITEPQENFSSMKAEFSKRLELMTSAFDKIPQISYIKPQGAFYLFCDFSTFGESFDVAKSILDEKNVAMIPGEGFGAPGYIRLSFATSEERIQEGVRRIAEWVQQRV